MDREPYDGRSNKATWAVSLHINNDQRWQERVIKAARRFGPEVGPFAEWLETWVRDVMSPEGIAELHPSVTVAQWLKSKSGVAFMDIGRMSDVDWRDLAREFLDAAAEGVS